MPLVTAIIPNYNHARYLERRLRSVLDQTLEDLEVIFMDDASTDASLKVFEPFRADPRVRALVNDRNGGSPFKQWNKGVQAARGKYVWIAESDDDADLRLLERVVGELEANPSCGLGCCESWLLHGEGVPTPDNTEPIDRPEPRTALWQRDFVREGREICAHDMIRANPMPNASAVVFRRSLFQELGGATPSMRLCGDWLMWTQMLLRSDLAHVGERLNFYRVHAGTVREHHRASPTTFAEVYQIMRLILDRADVPPASLEAALDARMHWLVDTLPPGGEGLRVAREVCETARQVDPAPRRRFARLYLRRQGGRAKRRVRRHERQAAFFGRALRHNRRERHELLARSAALLASARWRYWNRRQDQPTLLVGLIEHMGDIIACEPVARHLREQQPEARIVWAVRPAYRALVEHHTEIDDVAEVRCLTQWMMLKRHGGFDRTIDLHVPGRSCDDCVARLPRSPHAPQISAQNYYDHGSLLAIACQVAGLPDLSDRSPRMHLPVSARHRVDALDLPEQFAVIHGRSSQVRRDWDDAKWQELARRLPDEAGLAVVEVGTEPVLRDDADAVNLCGNLSLLDTAAVIAQASLFIGVDSGPAHMAHALATPGVVLLGRYETYQRYMPYSGRWGRGEDARIVQWPAPASEIPVDHVMEQAVELLAEHAHENADKASAIV